ncbi:MAG: TIGR04283 family arsenosugar biosynthesis glycosyltransferase [Ekhidna sp.]
MFISVIIPTLNEENNLKRILTFFSEHPQKKEFEVIVVDGGSTDRTIDQINEFDGVQLVLSKIASRAIQMNEGAKASKGEVLYFVHVDIQPVNSFIDDISRSIKSGDTSGCYRFKFAEIRNPLLHINGFFTRFPFMWCRGGDQTLYITRASFNELNGFNEDYVIMEDYELLERLKQPLRIIPKSVRVSARKYDNNSYLKVQFTNMKAMRMYKAGVKPELIKEYYLGELK